jgi:resuscitation-promoting factor RpfA
MTATTQEVPMRSTTSPSADPRRGPAALLGTVGALGLGGVAAGLVHGAVQAWPGTGAVDPAAALGWVSTAAAGALAGWTALLLAAAGWTLSQGPRTGAGSAARPAGTGMVAVVAGCLTALAALLLAPAAVAHPGPGSWPAGVVAAPLAPGPWPLIPPGSPGAPPSCPEPASVARSGPVPEPGWTPTTPRPDPVRPVGDVRLLGGNDQVPAAPGAPAERTVVVHRGDTLWSIAAEHLGPQATLQDVADAWPRWYAANRTVIGPDPDLLLPGQQLSAPAPEPDR